MQQALNRDRLRGIWVPLIVCWSDDGRLDEARYAASIQAHKGSPIHGVYTGGTTGEFYAQDDATFERITAITCEKAHEISLPVQIGCTAASTSCAIKRMLVARRCGADAIQFALPFWMELSDQEVKAFIRDLANAGDGMPLVFYQTSRTKKVLSPSLIAEIANDVPQLIGTKDTACSVDDVRELIRLVPDLAVFGGDRDIAEKIRAGGTGAYSAVALLNARFVTHLYGLTQKADWDEAAQRQALIRRFFDEFLIPKVIEERLMDSAIDRVQCVAGGIDVGLNCQKPYRSGTALHVQQLRNWCMSNAPQLLE